MYIDIITYFYDITTRYYAKLLKKINMNSNDKYNEDQQLRISKVEKFNEWMQEINSIYYANNKAMTNAFNKIYNEEI
jgi:hypothetical protein